MLEQFHFIRPLWLLALLPLAALAWRLARGETLDNPWRGVVDARLLPLLMRPRTTAAKRALPWLLAAGWLIAVLALAGPTWQRRAQPVFQTSAARVVVLDLSSSMNAADLQPSRLARARYKVEDVLALAGEGQTGLVAYAGDAFTVAPLTRDANTVRALLKVLEPSLMPVQGQRADLGLRKAGELLRQAGVSSAQVLLIADGVDPAHAAAADRAAAQLHDQGYRVSVLGVGTAQGAPLPDAGGQLQRDAQGQVVLTRLDTAALQALAQAGGGSYRPIDASGAALRGLLDSAGPARIDATTPATAQAWQEQGPLLVVLLLPLAALAFRRNGLFALVLLAGIAAPPGPAMASTWDTLWQRPDQQAAKALAAGDYAKAAAVATDPAQRASAEYKRGNYRLALQDFSRAAGSDADYNRGNALARLGRYDEAVQAYDKALAANPANEDARVNKAAVQALLEQQPQPSPKTPPPRSAPPEAHAQAGAQQSGAQQTPPPGRQAQAGTNDTPGPQAAAAGESASGSAQAAAHRPASSAASRADAAQQSSASASAAAQPAASSNEFADAARKLAAAAGGTKADAKPPANPGTRVAGSPASLGAQPQSNSAAAHAEALSSEEQMAAEQWLRSIPDDPGGLLRRKFLYQYRQRAQAGAAGG